MTQAISKVTRLADDALPFPPRDLWSDEPPLESDLHRDQIDLLIRQLRLFTENGSLVPLPEEAAEERAEQAKQRAGEAEQRAATLAAKLRELGIDSDRIS